MSNFENSVTLLASYLMVCLIFSLIYHVFNNKIRWFGKMYAMVGIFTFGYGMISLCANIFNYIFYLKYHTNLLDASVFLIRSNAIALCGIGITLFAVVDLAVRNPKGS